MNGRRPEDDRRALAPLAELYGVETSYYDVVAQRVHEVLPETLLGVLRALGAGVNRPEDCADAARERRVSLWRRRLPPVAVAWDGGPGDIELRLPAGDADENAACALHFETGEARRWACNLAALPTEEATEVEGARFLRKKFALPAGLPAGYHRLTVGTGKKLWETLVIAAPQQAYASGSGRNRSSWGVFLPLYALRSARNWGVGDFSDLEALMKWVQELGGNLVSTLPLLACFLDEPLDPSPYSPVSRLFWNELFVDVTRSPEFARSPAAQALAGSGELVDERQALQALPLVDYRRALALKRRVLEQLATDFFAAPGERGSAFARFVETHPILQDYARFRAVTERRRAPWTEWPAPLRDGRLSEADYDEAARRYHLYSQWLAHEQLAALGDRARADGVELYLDLPLGVHRAGYDVWRERAVFALEADGGAPPDPVFTSGQNWSFPPLHPERLREQGYRYFRHCLRHQMQHAGLLRLDHVMGLHRLFWIPQGAAPGEGAYVRYPADELYALVCLESHRNRCLVVGENLGLVPDYVNPTMTRHNLHKLYVLQYELVTDPGAAVHEPGPDAVAAFNTHDMYPLAAYWDGEDITERLRLGLLDDALARREREQRAAIKQALLSFLERGGWLARQPAGATAVGQGCARYLGASRARSVIMNLEDLWGERAPQNIPGSSKEEPNWQRKARYTFEEFSERPEVVDILRALDQERRSGVPV